MQVRNKEIKEEIYRIIGTSIMTKIIIFMIWLSALVVFISDATSILLRKYKFYKNKKENIRSETWKM